MSFRHFFAIFRARFLTFVVVLVAVVAATLMATLAMTPRYSATASVLVDVKSDPISGNPMPAQLLPTYLVTQMELLTSRGVALKVVDRLSQQAAQPALLAGPAQAGAVPRADGARPEAGRTGTARVPGEAAPPARGAPGGTAARRAPPEQRAGRTGSPQPAPDPGREAARHAAADRLLGNLKVKPVRDSNVLTLTYSDTEPSMVAVVANAFVRAYIDTTVEVRRSPAKENREFFDEQARSLREALEDAQARLSNFQRTRGILSNDERLDVENARLQQLATQLTAMQEQTIEAARRQQMARSSVGPNGTSDAPEVLQNSLILALKTDQARLESRLREQSTVKGSAHPEIVRLQQELEAVRSRIARETASVTSSLAKTYEVNRQREADLRAQFERQRAAVARIKQSRDELQVLQRDVEIAQRAYEGIQSKLTQSTLESQMVSQGTVVPIAAATPPTRPSSPNVVLNGMIGVAMGTMLGLAAALGGELARARVRLPDDLERSTTGPLLGVLDRVPRRMLRTPRNLPRLAYDQPRTEPELERAEEEAEAAIAAAMSLAARDGAAPGEREGPIPDERDGAAGHGGETRPPAADPAARRPLPLRPMVPPLDRSSSLVAREVLAAFDTDHPFLDDLRMLRSQIKARWIGDGSAARRAFAVVSQGPDEGKSFTAANLAVSFAQIGDRTLLVDADLRNGRVHELFHLDRSVGLANLLALQAEPAEALQPVDGLETLTVLTAGSSVGNSSDLLGSSAMGHLLRAFSRGFDVIIIDTPSAGAKPDAALVVANARGYVIVAREDRTLLRSVRRLEQSLASMGGVLIGSVLVRA